VELRAVIKESFSERRASNHDLAAVNYNPTIIDLVGIASIDIETDDDRHYYFQMTEQDLRSAIQWLSATLRELTTLQASVTLARKK
jgi:hypothetical protein